MTHADIIVRILAEVTGKPERVFRRILASLPAAHRGKLDQPCENAEERLSELRKEKAGILAWLIQGAVEVRRTGWSPPMV